MSPATWLNKALELAQIKQGFCAPNPAVGAVLVVADQIIGQGYHLGPGHPHAEVEALKLFHQVPPQAVLYITLEPCCHLSKRTPPCTQLLIEKQVKKVIYAYQDPNPQVAGRGEQILKEAGIDCAQFSLKSIEKFYQAYTYWSQTNRPFVIAKLALSLDGKIAGLFGKPASITGPKAQKFTHQQRKQSDAIFTTAKTIQSDNPQLNVRLDKAQYQKPVYILDRNLSLSPQAQVFKTAESVTLFYDRSVPYSELLNQVNCIPISSTDQQLNLIEALSHIGQQGKHQLWVEAGSRCFHQLWKARLLQKAFIYISAKCLGSKAQTAFVDSFDLIKDAKRYRWRSLHTDTLLELSW